MKTYIFYLYFGYLVLYKREQLYGIELMLKSKTYELTFNSFTN
jgi:hypothetical protein